MLGVAYLTGDNSLLNKIMRDVKRARNLSGPQEKYSASYNTLVGSAYILHVKNFPFDISHRIQECRGLVFFYVNQDCA
jgi:hypothetical protein